MSSIKIQYYFDYGCNRCMYTWDGNNGICPICNNEATHQTNKCLICGRNLMPYQKKYCSRKCNGKANNIKGIERRKTGVI